MVSALLTTKLFVPPARPDLVERPQLVERLDEGLARGHRLTLVSAPAGFGKTTLVVDWLARRGRRVAWLGLDEGDNDPVQFLRYLVAALQGIEPSLGRSLQEILSAPQMPSIQTMLTSLVNEVAAVAKPLTLVLDDYQLISAPEVHQVLRFLLSRQPPQLHLVVCTREDPPLPLAQLRARGQLTEIRERDLRFAPDEVGRFLEQTMRLRLPESVVGALEARTEGWIAGLQLAALALQEGMADPESFVATFTGDDRYVMDYLVAEVLERQPPAVRQFLRETSILEEMTAPLCDALTGRDDGQATLESLQTANLFIIPLDHRREWYRYHRLFAEALRTSLDPTERRALHRRAADWYEAKGLLGLAIRQALAGVEDADYADAERLIRRGAEEAILGGRIATLRGWLGALPERCLRADPELATYNGWALALTGGVDSAVEYADVAAARIAEGAPGDPGKLALLRGFVAIALGDYEVTAERASEALALLAPESTHWRVMALWSLAEAQERSRAISEAIRSLQEARQPTRALGSHVFAALIEASLAADLNHNGRRREAVEVCEEALGRYDDASQQASAALLLTRLGLLAYEADELDAARGYVARGLALGEQLPMSSPVSFSLGAQGLILAADGEVEAALRALHRGHRLALQQALADASYLRAWEANLHLRRGDLAAARRLAQDVEAEPSFLNLESQLTHVRLLIADGRLDTARGRLDVLAAFTHERELHRWWLSARILQALAAERSGDRAEARDRLAAAVRLAAPESYVRAFLDEDPRLVELLPDVRQAAPVFVARLLEGFGVARTLDAPNARLAEPLSERELEVLALIAQGHSNQQIADRLVIAPGTVKRHINNLYGKLEVASRTQAVAKARALRLV